MDTIIGILVDWLFVSGLVTCIGICFEYPMTLKICTGVWLIAVLIRWVLYSSQRKGSDIYA